MLNCREPDAVAHTHPSTPGLVVPRIRLIDRPSAVVCAGGSHSLAARSDLEESHTIRHTMQSAGFVLSTRTVVVPRNLRIALKAR
jgi:hypothetical protein